MIDAIQALVVVAILASALISGSLLAPYVVRVLTGAPTRLDRLLDPVEKRVYRLIGADPTITMGWKQYFFAALLLNVAQMAIAFAILVGQGVLPLNPQGFPGLSWDLALNTVVSFATNTNLQHYAGEATLSYFSQMTAIQFLQFTSATTGVCVMAAMIRGFKPGSVHMGNFYVDFVRVLTRLLLPLCILAALVFVALGVPQTIGGYVTVKTVEGATQTLLVGPVASLVAIMQIGTNGGGYFGANSAYPFQNPNPATDVLQIYLMLLIPTTLIFVFGEMIGKKKETRPILIGSYALLAIDMVIAFLGSIPVVGPGIETRFGGFFSTFWTVITTAVTTGSVNASLSAINPLGILSAFMGMLIQATPGGKGVGVMYMIMYIVITVFVVGLMTGRTPEYLGAKINARDVKLVMVAFLVHPIAILVPTIAAYATKAVDAIPGFSSLPTSVGFTQVLYEFASSAANNGSDFFGAAANTPFFNFATAAVIFVGRYVPIAILLALAGSMIGRKRVAEQSLRTDGAAFSFVLVGSILLLVVLTFLPFLMLGPLLTYFQGMVNFFG
ncbi:MAG: potassium-transporting ATPase subunit A [Nitrososphaerota archaeon]|nr:potassium-transporting ATPase subunit KdpA [Nitrososphaerota archaeon]MDG6913145.1 potassium-transporting ATPase subunit A [Nitrososphaerota archaeon]MDG6937297.1 potassium-transporting ATPase subunit A [Nitrososphaerota archaeon]MDG6961343.1 potassium-transporting ATPase subunit A [Nitrososphaerota archaeon]MDG6962839.1 potassium-transporting ATPase subunit A [Nitrososphaerota archaeon]